MSFFKKWFYPRSRLGVELTAALTLLMGLVNLLSAIAPSLPQRVHWLTELDGFEVRVGAHWFAVILGFLLLTLASNLRRRKRVAWGLTMLLVSLSIVSHLVKGVDWEEALLGTVLLIQLVLLRRQFTARSDRPSIAQGLRVLLGALLFTLAYGALGFYVLDRHYQVNFSWLEAVQQTLAMFLTEDNAGLQPQTRFGAFFADSIYSIGAVTVLYALGLLLRPVFDRQAITAADQQRAAAIVAQHGQSSLAWFALLPDKRYYFSPSGQTLVAYVAKGRAALALGDPIGPDSDRLDALRGFQSFCDRNDWQPAFYQTLPETLSMYLDLGYRAVQIGEEAIVDLQQFTLEGKAGKRTRNILSKFERLGYRLRIYEPPLESALLAQLRSVSDAWLKLVKGAEKRFSLGWFDDAIIRQCRVAVVEDPQGAAIAFANLVPEYQRNEVTIDLMRHRPDAEQGCMDYLFLVLLKECKQQGYDGFNLGLVALSGVGEDPNAPRLERGLYYLYNHLNRFYNFQGLRNYKEKFHPHWEPRYLVYPRLMALPEVVVGLVRADSGDRLWDYLRPGE
jgi:phosphatidylglycerol lysyltransferase